MSTIDAIKVKGLLERFISLSKLYKSQVTDRDAQWDSIPPSGFSNKDVNELFVNDTADSFMRGHTIHRVMFECARTLYEEFAESDQCGNPLSVDCDKLAQVNDISGTIISPKEKCLFRGLIRYGFDTEMTDLIEDGGRYLGKYTGTEKNPYFTERERAALLRQLKDILPGGRALLFNQLQDFACGLHTSAVCN